MGWTLILCVAPRYGRRAEAPWFGWAAGGTRQAAGGDDPAGDPRGPPADARLPAASPCRPARPAAARTPQITSCDQRCTPSTASKGRPVRVQWACVARAVPASGAAWSWQPTARQARAADAQTRRDRRLLKCIACRPDPWGHHGMLSTAQGSRPQRHHPHVPALCLLLAAKGAGCGCWRAGTCPGMEAGAVAAVRGAVLCPRQSRHRPGGGRVKCWPGRGQQCSGECARQLPVHALAAGPTLAPRSVAAAAAATTPQNAPPHRPHPHPRPPARPPVPQVVEFCKDNGIGMVMIGPEAPLVDGLADALAAAGVRAFGPSAAAAQLEGSKKFMKARAGAASPGPHGSRGRSRGVTWLGPLHAGGGPGAPAAGRSARTPTGVTRSHPPLPASRMPPWVPAGRLPEVQHTHSRLRGVH